MLCPTSWSFRGLRRLFKKDLEQVVEKAPAQVGGYNALVIPLDEPRSLGLIELAQYRRERHAGPLLEQSRRKPAAQAKRVHHEFETNRRLIDGALFLNRNTSLHRLQIALGMLHPHLPHDAIGKADLSVRA